MRGITRNRPVTTCTRYIVRYLNESRELSTWAKWGISRWMACLDRWDSMPRHTLWLCVSSQPSTLSLVTTFSSLPHHKHSALYMLLDGLGLACDRWSGYHRCQMYLLSYAARFDLDHFLTNFLLCADLSSCDRFLMHLLLCVALFRSDRLLMHFWLCGSDVIDFWCIFCCVQTCSDVIDFWCIFGCVRSCSDLIAFWCFVSFLQHGTNIMEWDKDGFTAGVHQLKVGHLIMITCKDVRVRVSMCLCLCALMCVSPSHDLSLRLCLSFFCKILCI